MHNKQLKQNNLRSIQSIEPGLISKKLLFLSTTNRITPKTAARAITIKIINKRIFTALDNTESVEERTLEAIIIKRMNK